MNHTQKSNLARLTDVWQHIDDLALVVLKGHLVIEQQLNHILESFVFHPDKLGNARLGFNQKIAIARSMSLDKQDDLVWQTVIEVNTLRNKIAHSLDPDKRKQAFERVKAAYLAENVPSTPKASEATDVEIAAYAISYCVGFLGSFQDEVLRFKECIAVVDKIYNPHRNSEPEGKT